MAAGSALADQRYDVSGSDVYQIGDAALKAGVRYRGTQELRIVADGKTQRFAVRAQYTRTDPTGTVPAQARFGQVMTAGGTLRDTVDADPDYLTVLNQPFAIELDAQTRSELLRLRGPLPFTFPAPMAGGTLTGSLQRGAIGLVDGRPVVAVAFDASGPATAGTPSGGTLAITGKMRMQGSAYYALRGAPLLLALQETLRIEGVIVQDGRRSPVSIVYRRDIRADDAASSMTTASSNSG